MEKRATYTTIVHKTLMESGLSAIEFIVADIIDKLSNPWCTMKRDKIEALCGISESGLRKILSKLEEVGFIERSRQKGIRSTEKWEELVYTEPTQSSGTDKKNRHNVAEVQHNVAEEPTQSNSLYSYNDIDNIKSETPLEKNENPLPLYFAKTPLQRIVAAYAVLWWDIYGTEYKANFGMVGKLYSPLLKELSEMQIAALFIVHFNWRGANGDDDFIAQRLEKEMFHIGWVPSKVNEYSTYITNVAQVNFRSPEAIKEYVRKEMGEALKKAVAGGIIKLPEKTTP